MYPKRRSVRLPGYDYAQPGEYFITINTHRFKSVFGTIDGERVRLTPIGQIAREEWLKTPILRPEIELGSFVIMPNHFHAIIHINDIEDPHVGAYGTKVRAYGHTPVQMEIDEKTPFRSPSRTVGAIVRGFKGAVTKRVNEYRGTPGATVWHRGFYEHIICSDEEYATIAAYIEGNPMNWEDRE